MASQFPAGTLEEAANTILAEVPNSVGPSGLRFERVEPAAQPARIAAVDAGSCLVLNVRSAGLYCVRAGYTLRHGLVFGDRITARNARTVTRATFGAAWDHLRRAYAWGVDVPEPPVDTPRVVHQLADAERVLTEFDAARRALHELRPGDVLLIDGALEDEERFAALRQSLVDRSQEKGVHLVAVAKDSCVSLGGVLPFPMEMEELAHRLGVETPWRIELTAVLPGPERPFRTFAMRFDARAPAYRVDVCSPTPVTAASLLLAACDDAAFAGYPYPLARIHQRVHYEAGESEDLRRDLEGIVARRRGHRLTERLFGKGRDVLELAR